MLNEMRGGKKCPGISGLSIMQLRYVAREITALNLPKYSPECRKNSGIKGFP